MFAIIITLNFEKEKPLNTKKTRRIETPGNLFICGTL